MAETVGFEPTVSFPTHAFQACRFGRSRTSPGRDDSLSPRLRPQAAAGSCATGARESGQGRKAAALSGTPGVPQIAWPPPEDTGVHRARRRAELVADGRSHDPWPTSSSGRTELVADGRPHDSWPTSSSGRVEGRNELGPLPEQGPDGGDGGIRTHGGLATTTVFETVPFVRSGNPPAATIVRGARRTEGRSAGRATGGRRRTW